MSKMGNGKVLFMESASTQLDDLLARVCQELQLTESRYNEAVARYESVAEWLDRPGSFLARFSPKIFPQGSMRIGTTVKPLGSEEHDLDFVCEFRVSPSAFRSPLELLRLAEVRLRQHDTYKSILEIKNRCVRLNYANEFHMDILPACPDLQSGGSCLVVPDRQLKCWKPSNPRGYATWFEKRCELSMKTATQRLMEKAEPVPPQESLEEKETLKRVVQLLKRWRDIKYRQSPELAPISMVLTTLAANAYIGQSSVAEAMSAILDEIVRAMDSSLPRLLVLNPENPQEDLSERWEDSAKYRAFVDGIYDLREQWRGVTGGRSIPIIAESMKDLFGAPVQVAFTKQAKYLQELREKSNLKVGGLGLIGGAGSAGVPIRRNTFHGTE
jgi:hypothetical protein